LPKLPFISSDSLPVYDRIIEVPGIAQLRVHLGKFLQSLYKLGPELPELYATLPVNVFSDSTAIPFLPASVDPKINLHNIAALKHPSIIMIRCIMCRAIVQ
jgi:hypothetical protein